MLEKEKQSNVVKVFFRITEFSRGRVLIAPPLQEGGKEAEKGERKKTHRSQETGENRTEKRSASRNSEKARLTMCTW